MGPTMTKNTPAIHVLSLWALFAIVQYAYACMFLQLGSTELDSWCAYSRLIHSVEYQL